MNIRKGLSIAIYISLLFHHTVVSEEIERRIEARIRDVEERVKKLKVDVERAYNEDKSKHVKNCIPSYHQCSENLPPDYGCHGGRGTHHLCKSCDQEEMQLSYTESTYMFPVGVFDPNNITPKQKETICVYK